MPTYYTDEEIDALVNDVKSAFLEPAFQLAKSEGKVYPTAKEGGNGVQTTAEHGLVHDSGERAETIVSKGQPSKTGKGTPSNLGKAAPPVESPESPEAEAAPAPDASPAPDEGAAPTSPDASAAPGAGPEMQGSPDAGGAPEQQNGPDELKAAYESLDDQSLQMHLQILSGVLKERMGQGGPEGQPGQEAGAPPEMGAPAGAPPGAGAPPPEQTPPPAGPPGMGKREQSESSSELSKSERSELAASRAEIKNLSKAVETVTEMFIKLTSQPKPKAITEMSELNKSETAPKATRDQVDTRLLNKSKDPNLLKSDRNLILRYFSPKNTVKFEEIEHLLK